MPAILKFSVLKINAEGKFCEILQSVAKGKKKKRSVDIRLIHGI
jgi:hypothetical protein